MSKENIKEIINDLQSQSLRHDLIQDNKLHFACYSEICRVRMPSQRDLLLAEEQKNAYELQLLESKKYKSLKQLKKILKENGIDISEMEKEVENKERQLLEVYEKLVKCHDDDNENIKKYISEIDKIKAERDEIIDEISVRINPSIDTQVENYYISFLTSVCTEKNIDNENNEWVRVWKSFNDYMEEEDSKLKMYAMGYLTHLLIDVKK